MLERRTDTLPIAPVAAVEVLDGLAAAFGRSRARRQARAAATRILRYRGRHFANAAGLAAKRAVDATVAGLAITVLSPFTLLIAAAIKLTDGGPVFYWQTRVGRHGRPFRFPKFRTMCTNSDALMAGLLARNQHGDSVTFKMRDDPRITRVGKWLRRFSLDETPQLWCVFTGQMSLVGPRPPVPREVALYGISDRIRLETTPGLTCIWQVSGRSDIPFEGQVVLDREYVVRQSFWLDLVLLVRTIPAVLTGRGAY